MSRPIYMESSTGFYYTKEEVEVALPTTKEMLKSSCFGATRVWIKPIIK